MAILERTPATVHSLLHNLPSSWTTATDGPNTWSPYDVIGHLIHCERADWMPRLEIILTHGTSRPFDPFDREAQFRESVGKTLTDLLDEFTTLRHSNLTKLESLQLTESDLSLEGTHPAFGTVTAGQLIATWTTHDLAHIIQISRTMARRYKEEVGPWAQYLSVMA
ncbi:MAG: DinB family protein [Acidobacteria bacterium]|nr:DinB family protein [Acidobacteriota bacterium]